LSNVTYSPSQRHAGTLVINIQSTFCTGSDLCKNVSFTVLFGSNGNSYTTIHSQIHTHTHTHILHSTDTLTGQEKYRNWDSSAGNLAACHSGQACQRILSPELCGDLPTESVPRNLFTYLYIAVVFRMVALRYFVCILESLFALRVPTPQWNTRCD